MCSSPSWSTAPSSRRSSSTAALPGASSQPVIAATNGGLMVAAFINGGTLYAVQQQAGANGWQAPQALLRRRQQPVGVDERVRQGISGVHGGRRRRP